MEGYTDAVHDRPVTQHRRGNGASTTTRSRGIAVAIVVWSTLWSSCVAGRPRLKVANTQQGRIAGIVTRAGTSFLGIPYAAPPVGPLRWREPEPAPRWDGVLGVDRERPRSSPEDCLRLDLFLPPTRAAALPVLVWFAHDAARLDGTRLAQCGIAVAVVHTRTGVLGTFAHPALERQRPGGPIEFALLDRLAALRWLRANAEALGIDPEHVTVAAGSADVVSLQLLLKHPDVAGLVHRAILHGPLPFAAPATRAAALQQGQQLLLAHGLLPATTASDLRALAASRLLELPLGDGALAGPVADGTAVGPHSWRDLISAPAATGNAIDLLVGSVDRGDPVTPTRRAATPRSTPIATAPVAHPFQFPYR